MKKRVIARVFIKNGSIEAFKKQSVEMIQRTRNETGCLLYDLFQGVSSPGEFLFYEEYVDQDALDVHFRSDYLKSFRDSTDLMRSKDTIVDVI